MLRLPFDRLDILKQHRRKNRSKELKYLSYDTETVNGRCHLLADSGGNFIHPNSFGDCVQFLCRKSTRGHLGFFYNLKYDTQAILKWLEPHNWMTLHETNVCIVEINYIDYYHNKELNYEVEISYIPKKILSLKILGKRRNKWVFYDISQYYNKMKLDNAGAKYLGMRKNDTSNFDMTNVTIENCHDPEFIAYCIQDCKITQGLAELFLKVCSDNGLEGANFSSPASLSYDYFAARTSFPTINKFIESEELYPYLIYPWESISGAFISVFQRGYFPHVSVYDINSSYPTRIAKLPDLEQGRFYFDDGEPSTDYQMGWLRCEVNITKGDEGWYHPCFPVIREHGANYYPIGHFSYTMTLSEYRYFSQFFDIKPIEGLYWQASVMSYPFRETVNNIYNTRKQVTDIPTNLFLKTVLNGLYGKFLQKTLVKDPKAANFGYWKTGPAFSPFYASYILADSRIQVFDLLRKIDSTKIVACFTDSVITTEDLTWLPVDKQLGNWGFDKSGEAIIIGCGIYSIKHDGKTSTKLRGFNLKHSLFDLVNEHLGLKEITIKVNRNINMYDALTQKRYDDMNLIEKQERTININFDTKRIWSGAWKTCNDILTKPPLTSIPYLKGLSKWMDGKM